MKNVNVVVDDTNSLVYPDKKVVGMNYENLQGYIIFTFKHTFIDGVAWLEVKMPDNTTGYLALTKENSTYKLPIKSSLLKQKGKIFMQLRITEEEVADGIPVFKSNMFYLQVNESLNTTTEVPDEYADWITIADEKIIEINKAIEETNNLNIETERVEDGVNVTITKKDGTTDTKKLNDGASGGKGEDAKINGVNSLNIVAGENITTSQDGSTFTINAVKQTDNNYTTDEKNKLAGLKNYDDTDIKKEIAGKQDKGNYSIVTETGNKIDLSIDSSTYIMTLQLKDKNNNVLSTGIIDLPLESVVVSGRYDSTTKKVILTLQSGSTIEFSVADLVAGLQSEITEKNKLSYNLLKDTPDIPNKTSQLENDSGFLTEHQDISGKEDKFNKVTTISSSSIDTEYPSAKAVYDEIKPSLYVDSDGYICLREE